MEENTMKLLKPEDVAIQLGITKAALRELRLRNKSFPPPIRVSERVLRWDETDINEWLNERRDTVDG